MDLNKMRDDIERRRWKCDEDKRDIAEAEFLSAWLVDDKKEVYITMGDGGKTKAGARLRDIVVEAVRADVAGLLAGVEARNRQALHTSTERVQSEAENAQVCFCAELSCRCPTHD